jgi:hypothetical protein
MAKSDSKEDMKMDLAQDKKMIKAAVGKHEKNMHPGKTPTKLKAGGKTNSDMLKYGRGMAKVMNQRSVGRGG